MGKGFLVAGLFFSLAGALSNGVGTSYSDREEQMAKDDMQSRHLQKSGILKNKSVFVTVGWILLGIGTAMQIIGTVVS